MIGLNIEYRPFTDDDFSLSPKCFDNEFVNETTSLFRHDNCGMINTNDNHLYYFHNLDKTNSRWSGIIRLGDSPLDLQKEIADTNIAFDEPTTKYGLINDNPKTYGIRTTKGIPMEFEYNAKGCHLIESNILDVKGEWFPNGLVCHMGSEYNIPFMHLPVLLKGTYKGEPIEFLACIDRIFGPEGKEKEILVNATSYISSYCSGIRQDGRREWFMGLICHNNGYGLGVYWLENEEPIISDKVINEGIWQRLPYVNDDTVVCIDNVWKFGGKEFHVLGKWGAKGFTAKPRLDRHGQSQMFGTWYEGSVPYKHKIWNTFNENMEAYALDMKKRGFKVID